ncbi:metal-dependent hydrolase [Agaribacterium sp. ZY112]|uniref:metal-dependent hydrolase n=1 Tax=Agaribacterium sp. ZY112 TaxID=3233574 RepID=UPI0035257BC5
MANGPTHQLIGGLTALAVMTADKEENRTVLHHPLVALACGALLGKLPDVIEPANNPHHRQFFHGCLFLTGVGYGVKQVWDMKPQTEVGRLARAAGLIVGGAYISHLLADAVTPRSLPLIGKL